MEDSASSSSDAVPRPSQQSCTNSQKTFYSVTYALPGQIAYCIPRMSADPKYRQNLLRLLEAQSGIRYQEINEDTGSLVIAYESGLMSDMEMREHLASLFQAAETTKDTEVTVPPTKEPTISPSPPQSVTNSRTTEQPEKVAYSVVHSIPGRVRFHVPQIATDPAYIQRLEALLQSDPVVISKRINRHAASVIITYQPGKVRRPPQQPLQSIFAVAVAYFSSLIESAGITANISSNK
ncbi:hypothetical protein [Nostoc sp. MS1]|uniref:hypothetical protein n=1 Tax=Nostoc sp. MS1 TaxID=2764711 RepID=UPI001CC6816A|nr:hypothetical protein [Nostoc sp. MS1]BCL39592.1 hypothetical protein NSMS1_60390 [Nostoc sp. MS1]